MKAFLMTFISIASLHFLAMVSPGPDFVLVTQNALLYPKRIAIYTALGITLGIVIHVSYCVLGLAVIISESVLLFSVIKYMGAAYLIYIGSKALFVKSNFSPESTDKQNISGLISPAEAVKQGFFCNALNPKASLFFLGLFTLFLKPTTPWWEQAFFGVWMVFATFVWFASIGTLITSPHVRTRIIRIQPIVTKVMGILLILFGIRLVFW